MNPEIFGAFQELKGLDDNTFSFDKPGIMKLNRFLTDADGDKEEEIVVVDPEATKCDDLKDDYNGEVILKCCVCNGLITKEPKEVKIDKELNRANVGEDCPYCYNDSGFDIVGKVNVPKQLGDDEEVEEFVAEEEPVEEAPVVEEDFTGGPVEFVQRVLGVPVYRRGDGVLTATYRGKSVQSNDIAGIEDKIRGIGDEERKKLDRLPESKKSLKESWKKTPTDLFKDYLDLTEFALEKDGDSYRLTDLQGGNLGNIESDRFDSAKEIFDRMDDYIYDYYVRPIEEEAENVGFELPDGDLEALVNWYKEHKDEHPEYADDFAVLDMIVNHADEVDLSKAVSHLFDESYKKACKRAVESVSKKRALKEGFRSNIIEFPSGDYVYVGVEDGKLYAGGATNTGIFHEYEIDIEGEEPTDWELQDLYDKIIEEHPEYLEETLSEAKNSKFVGKFNRPLTDDEIDKFVEVISDAAKNYGFDISKLRVDSSDNKKKPSFYGVGPVKISLPVSGYSGKFRNFRGDTIQGINNIIFYCRCALGYPDYENHKDKLSNIVGFGNDNFDSKQYSINITTDGYKKDYRAHKDDKYRFDGKDFYLYDDTIDEFESGIINWFDKFLREVSGDYVESCLKTSGKSELTEVRADEVEILDLWDEVYGAVAGDSEYKKGTHKRNNGVGLKPDRFNPVNDNDIEVRGVDFDELKPVKDVIDNEFAGRGVTYDEYINKHDRKYPARVVIHIPEDEIIDDVSVKIVKNGDKKDLGESVETISVETDSDVVKVEPSEDGKIKVEAEPKEEEKPNTDAVIEPVDDELKAEIEANTDGDEEETGEVESSDNTNDIEEIDETEFDELGESYLKEVYNNVDSFKTTGGYVNGDKIKLEGVIKFKSGKQAKTSFVFESISKTSRGKYKMIGENLQITNRKNAYILTGKIKDKKFCLESLTYNYTAKDANGGKSIRAYGTKKLNK